MNWLITTRHGTDLDELRSRLAKLGAEVNTTESPIPMGADEQVIEVTGPRDLPQKLASDRAVLKVYPNSEMELY